MASEQELEEYRERQQIKHQISQHQQKTFQAVQGAEMPEWLGSDMTMPQFKILFLLNAHGRLRMKEIAEYVGKNLSTATGVVDRLVEHNLIRREEDPDDRRVVIATLTEDGAELCRSFLQAGWQNVNRMLDRLTLDELRIVEQGTALMARVAFEEFQERLETHRVRRSN